MRGARGRAYAVDGRIWYSVVSSRMNQLYLFKQGLKILLSYSSAHQVGQASNLPEKNMLKNVNIKLECNLHSSGFSFLLAVATFFTGSRNFFCQWELYNWQWECLMHFIPNNPPLNLMLQLKSSISINVDINLVFKFSLQSAMATQQWNSFALTVAKCTSSGITITSSGNALEHFIALTVRKCTSRGITITSSGNVLDHFIPNNPPLNLMLHLQSIFLN
nr:hypothetical protein [Tanacetum cinerariifolium]